MAEWKIVGQVGTVIEKDGGYVLNIAKNHYPPGSSKKAYTIWFNCFCIFEPNCQTGDKVLVDGFFDVNTTSDFPYSMRIKNIGVIKKGRLG